jgi:WhiB family redox-sensing transcriptional regulator
MVGRVRGACSDVDPEVLTPAPGDTHAEAVAKRLCASCVIRIECRKIGLQTKNLQGIWGGLTATERLEYARAHPSSSREH